MTATEAPCDSPVAAPELERLPDADLAWLQPKHRAAPAEALQRIRTICEQGPAELFPIMLTVLATHQAVPREILAAAIKQFRRDCDSLSRDDLRSLLNAIWTGGQQGFDAVLRTRKNADRKPGALSWVRSDD